MDDLFLAILSNIIKSFFKMERLQDQKYTFLGPLQSRGYHLGKKILEGSLNILKATFKRKQHLSDTHIFFVPFQ